MMDRELFRQALDALELIDEAMPFPVAKLTIKNLRERLAQPEQEFIKHHGDDEGWSEWVCPDPKDYLMKCCDCGLVHEAQFRVVRYKSKTELEDCDMVSDFNLQAVFRMRRSEQWSPVDTAHRAGGMPMAQPEQEQWDAIPDAFNEWWDADYDDTGNPYRKDSPAYWAWSGWKAASKQPEQKPVAHTTGHCENHQQKGGCQLHNLQCGWPDCDRKPITATQPEQEPVAGQPLPCPFCGASDGLTMTDGSTYRWGIAYCNGCGASAGETRRAYPDDGKWYQEAIQQWNQRAPQPAQQPLTDEEIEEAFFDMGQFAKIDLKAFARAIEAAHGIKENT